MLERAKRDVTVRIPGAGGDTPHDRLTSRQGYHDVRVLTRMPLPNDRNGASALPANS